MKKLLVFGLTSVLIVAMALGVVLLIPADSKSSTVVSAQGNGTIEDPFQISNAHELNTIVRDNLIPVGRHFVLTSDIDMDDLSLSEFNWVPMGSLAGGSSFDGRGFTIRNMRTTSPSNAGLFGRVIGGTIRNVNIENAHVRFSDWNAGFIAGQSSANNSFENIRIDNQSTIMQVGIGTGGTSAGGVIGFVDSGHSTFYNILNEGSVSAGHSIGGIVGRVGGTTVANVTMSHVGNLGTIEALSTGANLGRAGGILGVAEGNANITINWAFNRGAVSGAQSNIAGILGVVLSGMARINNSINDSTIVGPGTRSGIGSRAGGMLIVSNVWFNSSLFTGHFINNDAIVPSLSGTLPTGQLRTTAHLAVVNANGEGDYFIIQNNQITLDHFVPRITYTFLIEGFDNIVIRELVGQGITLPNPPQRIGFLFVGWRVTGTIPTFPAGQLFPAASINTTFEAVFEAGLFYINWSYLGPLPSSMTPALTQNGVNMPSALFGLGMQNVALSVPSGQWTADQYRWLAQHVTGDNYSNLGINSAVDISAIIDEEFISRHAQGAPTGAPNNVLGTIYITIRPIASTFLIQTQGVGGSVGISINNGTLVNVVAGDVLTLQIGGGSITQLVAQPDEHFVFSSFRLVGGGLTTIQTSQQTHNPTGPYWTISSLQTQGRVLEINFTPIRYQVTTISRVRDEATNLASVITTQPQSQVYMGADSNLIATAAMNHSIANSHFRFAVWQVRLADGTYQEIQEPNDNELNWTSTHGSIVNHAWLSDYLRNGVVTLVAEYVRVHQLTFAVLVEGIASGEANPDAFGNLSVTIWDSVTNEPIRLPSSFGTVMVAQGSNVDIVATASGIGEFTRFDSVAGNSHILDFDMTADRTVLAVFIARQFEVVIRAIQQAGPPVPDVQGFPDLTLGAGDQLLLPISNIVATNFRLDSLTINLGNETINLIQQNGIIISPELLNDNLAHNQFIITAIFTRVFTLNVEFALDSYDMGTYDVYTYNNGVWTSTQLREFERDTVIRVVPKPHPFHTRVQNYIEIDDWVGNRNIVLNFIPQVIILATNLQAQGNGELVPTDRIINAQGYITNLRAGARVTLVATPPSGRQVRNWTLNGQNIFELGNVEDIGDGHVIITLSHSWLEEQRLAQRTIEDGGIFTVEFESEVTFRLTIGVLLAILLPSIIIPLLAIIVVIYLIRSNKKYKKVKAELVAENRRNITLNTGGFIRDLKDGKNVGSVTDKDIKDRMKQK